MKRKRIVSVISEKGGVGKTATLLNLAGAIVCTTEKKVLVADLNPQQDLATNLGHIPGKEKTISELIRDKVDTFPIVTSEDLKSLIKHSSFGLDYLPAVRQTLEYLPKIMTPKDKYCVAEAFNEDIFDGYDYIFIDCKDSLTEHLVPQILAASDYVIPVAEVGINSLYDVAEVINKITNSLGAESKIAGVVLNKVANRSNVSKEIIEAIREGYGKYLFRTEIPDRKAQIENAIRSNTPCVIAKDAAGKKNTLADYYKRLAKEFIERIEG